MQHSPTVLSVVLEILLLGLILIAVPILVYFDLVFLSGTIREISVTQFTQHLTLFVGGVVFAFGARRYPEKRGYLGLWAFFFLILFIREHNGLFNLIAHGFWKVPALITLIAAIIFARVNRETIKLPFLKHFESRGFGYMLAGLLTVIVFSRLFGSSVVLRDALGDNYLHVFKTINQEGLELLGESILMFGACVSFYQRFSVNR